MNRRDFLKGTALGFPALVPASVFGAGAATPPSERIVMGCIGLGMMGTGDMRGFLQHEDVHIAAVCDVRESARQRAKNFVDARYGDKACASYNDFRELLERKDIDAVMIATGERWHPLIATEAARRGKHMYCEKPLALSVEQAKAVRQAVQHYGVIFQFGTQQRSTLYFRFACELARNGRIGQVQSIAIGSAGGYLHRELQLAKPQPVPSGFDFDMWLGPAPWAPYSDLRVAEFTWMNIYDYGLGGMGGEYGVHDIDIAQWVSGCDHTTPVSVEGTGELYRDIRDTVSDYEIEYRYANGIRVNFMDLPAARKRFWQFQYGKSVGVVIFGTEGWIWVSREGIRTHPESLARTVIGPNEFHVAGVGDHKTNFLDAVKSGRQTVSPIEVAAHSDMMCNMGDIAVRLKRKLRWDPVKEVFLDDEEANRRLSRPMRSPWRLSVPGPSRSGVQA